MAVLSAATFLGACIAWGMFSFSFITCVITGNGIRIYVTGVLLVIAIVARMIISIMEHQHDYYEEAAFPTTGKDTFIFYALTTFAATCLGALITAIIAFFAREMSWEMPVIMGVAYLASSTLLIVHGIKNAVHESN